MNAKEKANELVDKFSEYAHTDFVYIRGGYQAESQLQNAKQCALILVDEILKCEATEPSDTDWDDCGATALYYWPQKKVDAGKFWGDVKQEINNI